MESRVTNEYNNKASSIKEYAYLEDRNYPTRPNMEDSISWIIKTILQLIHLVRIQIQVYLLYLMVMVVLK
jgi:hypothetical protein